MAASAATPIQSAPATRSVGHSMTKSALLLYPPPGSARSVLTGCSAISRMGFDRIGFPASTPEAVATAPPTVEVRVAVGENTRAKRPATGRNETGNAYSA